jgi:protein tyrosine/serine phosphatase
MQMHRKSSLLLKAAVGAVLVVWLQANSLADTGNRIRNFGRIDQNYRGGHPKHDDYAYLSSIGVKCVIDLERRSGDAEKEKVESAGMRFCRIPMSDSEKPTAQQVEEFLKIVNDPKNQPFFLHCHAGRDRTGAMAAIYRMAHDGWNADKAYAEMKQYHYGSGVGHGAMKSCVYDYSHRVPDQSKTVDAKTNHKASG